MLDIVSEYRALVIDGQVKALNNYIGDWKAFPDPNTIIDMVTDYTLAPIGYSLDVGVTNKGETVLIECNDGWSLGNYGACPVIYTNLLMKRWNQLMTT